MHKRHRAVLHGNTNPRTIVHGNTNPRTVMHAKLACTTTHKLVCMTIWHAHQPLGCCASQFGMHTSPWAAVHAKLACTPAKIPCGGCGSQL